MTAADSPRDRMNLGRLGIWTYQLNYQPTTKVREVVAELESWGMEPSGSVRPRTGSR